jgi:hypothetical protein
MNAVRCGRLDPGAEEGATTRRHATEDPRGRGPDDLTVRVQPLDRELYVVGPVAGTLVVDVAADCRPRRGRRNVVRDPKVLIERLLSIDRGEDASDLHRQ